MSRPATILAMVAGALAGAYLAAVNCPPGWWTSADLAAGAARIAGGMAIGIILTVIITLCVRLLTGLRAMSGRLSSRLGRGVLSRFGRSRRS